MKLVAAAVIIALALASPAAAVDEPGAFGIAQRGSLKVVAGVLLSERGGEMKGVWLDGKQGCLDRRRLRVAIQIDLVSPAGKTTRIRRSRTGFVDNCAEGGPNFGFDVNPRALGLGCADGRWAPGRYALSTTTIDLASGLKVTASLYRQVTRRC
jgi:hypothetical protein